tara:strand:+ start:855 stop:2015 length:1161 start_codon:yes stop_codon:yes gene_type:complete
MKKTMNKNWFKIVNKAKSNSKVFIYDEIGLFGVSAKDFVDALSEIEGDWDLHINSGGGSVFDGFAIHNAIKSHPGKVTAYIDGMAASIASHIILAADTVQIAENGWIMIHNPAVVSAGGSDELRRSADLLDGLKTTLVDAYESATNITREEIVKLMDAETWLNAQDALEHGFVDTIGDPIKAVASVSLDKFKNAPVSLKQTFQNAVAPGGAKATQQKPKTKDKNMSIIKDKLVALNVVGSTASDEDAASKLNEFVDYANKNEKDLLKASADLESANERIEALEAQNKATALEGFTAQVDAAIEAKRVQAEQKDALVNSFKASPEAAAELLKTFKAPVAPTNGSAPIDAANSNDDLGNDKGKLSEKNSDGTTNFTNVLENQRIESAS